jgi:hypothetical protein
MLKITGKAVAQPQIKNYKDGWGHPRQTIYVKGPYGGNIDRELYNKIKEHHRRVLDDIYNAWREDPDFFREIGLDLDQKLPQIYNDPTTYTFDEIGKDIIDHYNKGHDPCVSMANRLNWILRKIADALTEAGQPGNTILKKYGIEFDWTNPTEPTLKKFKDRDVWLDSAELNTSTFADIFARG